MRLMSHGVQNENLLSLSSLKRVAKTLVLFAVNWCGVRED